MTERIFCESAPWTASLRTLTLAATLTLSNAVSAAVISGPITSPINGHTYYLLSQNTWTGAQAEAVTLGGNLVTIRNAAEEAWIQETFGSSSHRLWIGLTDQEVEGTFVWISGEVSTYRNWDPGEPNDQGGEDYVHKLSRGTWNDLANSLTQSRAPMLSVAEIPGIPEPSTWAIMLLGLTAVATRFRKAKLTALTRTASPYPLV
jgi:hypothetical protein